MTSSNKGSKDERNDDNDMIIRRLYDNKHDDYEDYNDDNDDERDVNDDKSDDNDNNNDDRIPSKSMATSRHLRASRCSRGDPPRLLPRLLGGGARRSSRGLILSTVTRARHHYSSIFNKPRRRQVYMGYLRENGPMPSPP